MTQDDDKEKAEPPYSMRRPQMENFMQTEKNPFVNYEVKRQSSVKTNSSLNNKFLMHHWYSLINVSHQMLHDSCWRRTSSYLVWLNSTTNHNSVPNEDANLKPWYLNKMPNEEEKKPDFFFYKVSLKFISNRQTPLILEKDYK